MQQKCFLHIGTHKTGTTSVQSCLYKNRNLLKEKSIFYPAIIKNETDAGHHSIAATIAKNNNYDSLKKETKIENLLQQIKSSDCETIIISSEIFSTINPWLVKKVFAEFNCKVICFLRRQDDLIESMYRELIKNSNFLAEAEDFKDIITNEKKLSFSVYQHEFEGILPFDYEKFLNKWADCFGKNQIEVYVYNEPNTDGDSVKVFLKAVNLSLADFPEYKQKHFNDKFQSEILQLRQIIDKKLSPQAQSVLRASFWWANNHFKSSDYTYFFDTKNRKQIMGMVAESNEAVAKTYLEDSKASWLKKDFVIEVKHTISELDNDALFQCMSLLIAHQATRINHQTKQILKLQQEIVKIQESLSILRK